MNWNKNATALTSRACTQNRNARVITCSAVAGRRRIKVDASPAADTANPSTSLYIYCIYSLHLYIFTYYHLTLATLCRNDMGAFSTRSVIITLYIIIIRFFLIYFSLHRNDLTILNGWIRTEHTDLQYEIWAHMPGMHIVCAAENRIDSRTHPRTVDTVPKQNKQLKPQFNSYKDEKGIKMHPFSA